MPSNPLRFIDPDGAFPIDIYLRSFAPFKSFGAGLWHGDNRGYSTSQNVSSRISQVTSYETTTQEGNTRAYGGISASKYGAMAYSEAYLNDGKQSVSTKGNNISTHLYGNNDAVLPSMSPGALPPDGGPTWDIDLHSNLKINVTNGENGNQILNISGAVSGDAFPSAEAFVSGKGVDGKPVSVFLNVAAAAYDGNTGPFVALAGDNKRPMMNINTSIIVNSNGQFTGVMQGNKTIRIQDWNKNFEQKKP